MKKRYLGLFSVIAMVLAIMAASCSVDSTDSNDAERNGQLKLVLNVPSVPSFADEAATKTIGVPDPGKTSWEQGDSIIVLLGLDDTISHTALGAFFIIGYDGTAWGTDGRAYVLYGDYEEQTSFICDFSKEGAFISEDGSITLPDVFPRAHTYNIIFCYAPGARYDGFNNEFLYKKGQIGLSEEWIGYLDETEIPSNGVLRTSEMEWKSNCSRIRVSAAPGDKVTLKATTTVDGQNFSPTPECARENSIISENVGEEDSPLFENSTTADKNGNAFFYAYWNSGILLTVSVNDKVVFETTTKNADQSGSSYVIDTNS